MSIDVGLRDAIGAPVEAADGYVIYRGAHASGAAVLHRALPQGTEDYVSFETRPNKPEVVYEVDLGRGVAGLRLVARTLELLDAAGAPRLRMAPPSIAGADGLPVDAMVAIAGCAFDPDPVAPWGRPVVPPGAATCEIRVSWPEESVRYPAVLDPRWTTTGSMATPRQGHTATLLSNGTVLVAGGSDGTNALATAELFDRATGTWATTGSMAGARQLHSATQLGTSSNGNTSGKVLVAGGINGTISLATTQLYSPSSGTWSAAGNLNAARHAHTATLLADGRVLVAGGMNGTTTLATAALYSPVAGSGSWTATVGPIPPPGLRFHTATRIVTTNSQLNNKVLLTGGNNGGSTISAVYLFDPAQSAFSTLQSMPSPREGHAATILPNGKILLSGGKNGTATLNTAVSFDPSIGPGSWSGAGTMISPRQGHTATLLSSAVTTAGQVLVTGGSNGSSTVASAELFSGTSTWAATVPMIAAMQGHTATLLGNGMVLVTGGVSGPNTLHDAQIYDPSSGLGCSSNDQCATGFCVSGICCNSACSDQCSVCNLPGSVGVCSPKPNGTACNDGNLCTQTDTCQSGSCFGANPVTCTALDMCHDIGACNSATGACSNPEIPNTVCVSNTTVLKCIPGSSLTACVGAVVKGVGESTSSQHDAVVADLQTWATVPGFASSLANTAVNHVMFSPGINRVLIEVAILGEMKADAGTTALKQIIQMPLPESGTCFTEDGSTSCSDTVERARLSAIQVKAIEGLAFLRNSDGDNEVLTAVANGTNFPLQATAVAAYLWNRGNTVANRVFLAGMLPAERRFLVDRFIKDASMTEAVLGPTIIDFYNKHPELLPAFPN